MSRRALQLLLLCLVLTLLPICWQQSMQLLQLLLHRLLLMWLAKQAARLHQEQPWNASAWHHFSLGCFTAGNRRLHNSLRLCVVQEEESCIEQGPRRAHAGIMAAATAIWKDLRVHRILPALLNVSSDSDDEDNPEYDIGAGMQSSLLGNNPHIHMCIYSFCMRCARRIQMVKADLG